MHYRAVEPTGDHGDDEQTHHIGMASSHAANDPLDDVFGSDEVEESRQTSSERVSHPSDMHRLEVEHTTAGYREGLTVAKETSIQDGFDEGFSLGATIGLTAGQIVGFLEAIAEALGGGERDAAAEAAQRLADAKADLSQERLFSPEFWAGDGNWAFEVEGEEGHDVLFADIAKAHPVVRKWTAVLDSQITEWGLDLSLFNDGAHRLENAPVGSAAAATSSNPQEKKPLDW